MQSITVLESIFSKLILEDEITPFNSSPTDFIRNRKLPLKTLITLILHLSHKGNGDSVASNMVPFLSSIGTNTTIDRSAVTRARSKISYKYFNFLFKKIITTIYENEKCEPQYLWKGFNLIGIDGSKVNLPATPEIREVFDPKSGLRNGRSHYP